MKSTMNITCVTNTLKYICLLRENEQVLELNKILQHLKNINKSRKQSGNYRKLLKEILYLSRLNAIL